MYRHPYNKLDPGTLKNYNPTIVRWKVRAVQDLHARDLPEQWCPTWSELAALHFPQNFCDEQFGGNLSISLSRAAMFLHYVHDAAVANANIKKVHRHVKMAAQAINIARKVRVGQGTCLGFAFAFAFCLNFDRHPLSLSLCIGAAVRARPQHQAAGYWRGGRHPAAGAGH